MIAYSSRRMSVQFRQVNSPTKLLGQASWANGIFDHGFRSGITLGEAAYDEV